MANSTVAGCALLADATAQLGPERRNRGATPDEGNAVNAPMTGRELRAQLKAQQGRNRDATSDAATDPQQLRGLTANDMPKPQAPADPATERRRAKAIALLEAKPGWKRAVILETGAPPVLAVAIRGVAYGELELPTDYDPVLIVGLLDSSGQAPTVH